LKNYGKGAADALLSRKSIYLLSRIDLIFMNNKGFITICYTLADIDYSPNNMR